MSSVSSSTKIPGPALVVSPRTYHGVPQSLPVGAFCKVTPTVCRRETPNMRKIVAEKFAYYEEVVQAQEATIATLRVQLQQAHIETAHVKNERLLLKEITELAKNEFKRLQEVAITAVNTLVAVQLQNQHENQKKEAVMLELQQNVMEMLSLITNNDTTAVSSLGHPPSYNDLPDIVPAVANNEDYSIAAKCEATVSTQSHTTTHKAASPQLSIEEYVNDDTVYTVNHAVPTKTQSEEASTKRSSVTESSTKRSSITESSITEGSFTDADADSVAFVDHAASTKTRSQECFIAGKFHTVSITAPETGFKMLPDAAYPQLTVTDCSTTTKVEDTVFTIDQAASPQLSIEETLNEDTISSIDTAMTYVNLSDAASSVLHYASKVTLTKSRSKLISIASKPPRVFEQKHECKDASFIDSVYYYDDYQASEFGYSTASTCSFEEALSLLDSPIPDLELQFVKIYKRREAWFTKYGNKSRCAYGSAVPGFEEHVASGGVISLRGSAKKALKRVKKAFTKK